MFTVPLPSGFSLAFTKSRKMPQNSIKRRAGFVLGVNFLELGSTKRLSTRELFNIKPSEPRYREV